MSAAGPFSDDDIAAFLDGELDPALRDAVAAWLREHPEAQRRAEVWRAQTAALRAALDPVAEETVPAALTAALDRPPVSARVSVPLRLAAAALIAGVLGGLIGLGGGFLLWGNVEQPSPYRAIAAAALSAHQVYSAEQRHAVEVSADDATHLANWLSNRLDATIAPPDLSAEGLTLLGGRLVAEDGRPAALLMYEEGGDGARYTVFVFGTDSPDETPLRYARAGDNCAFYWVDGRLAFVVSGPDDPDRVREIARAVYADMG